MLLQFISQATPAGSGRDVQLIFAPQRVRERARCIAAGASVCGSDCATDTQLSAVQWRCMKAVRQLHILAAVAVVK